MTTHAVALITGRTDHHTAIAKQANATLAASGDLSVRAAADAYARAFAMHRYAKNERTFLTPLGQTTYSLLALQQSPNTEYLLDRMQQTDLGITALISGYQPDTGGQIFLVRDPGEVTDMQMAGFSAIGMGEWHAQSQFMFERYTREWPFARALLLTYLAKKRADVAPSVGPETDLFVINGDGYQQIVGDLKDSLDGIYKGLLEDEKNGREAALQGMEAFVERWVERPVVTAPTATAEINPKAGDATGEASVTP